MKKATIFAIVILFAGFSQLANAQNAENPALNSLTKENAVFVYCDYLTGLDDYLTTIPGKVYRNNVTAFTKLNQVFPLPSAILGDEGEWRGKFYPEIRQYVTNNTKEFLRTTPSAYTDEFASWLKSTGRKNVIIGGISIDNCTLHTSLDLLRNGYNVYVLLDVSSTNNKLAEDAAIMRLTKAGAVPTTWIAMATELVKDWNTPEGQKLTQTVMMPHMIASTVGEVSDPTADQK